MPVIFVSQSLPLRRFGNIACDCRRKHHLHVFNSSSSQSLTNIYVHLETSSWRRRMHDRGHSYHIRYTFTMKLTIWITSHIFTSHPQRMKSTWKVPRVRNAILRPTSWQTRGDYVAFLPSDVLSKQRNRGILWVMRGDHCTKDCQRNAKWRIKKTWILYFIH